MVMKILLALNLVALVPCLAMEDWEYDLEHYNDDSLFESPISAQKELSADDRSTARKLRAAIKNGKQEIVLQFLENGGDPETRLDKFGIYTLLMYASHKDQLEICELLIARGANVNARNEFGMTPMLFADPNLKLYQLLVTAGADVNAQCMDGYTALIMAAQDGGAQSCEFLINHGASIHAQASADGFTPLISGACCSNRDVCSLILDRQKKYNEGIILALLYLKNLEGPYAKFIYRERTTLLKPHLERYTLAGLLNAKTDTGLRAYDFLKIECLRPKGEVEEETNQAKTG